MPKKIVKKYQDLYRKNFARQTLEMVVPCDELKVQAFDDKGTGFPDCWIYMHIGKPAHPSIWACNIPQEKDGKLSSVILVNPDFVKLPAEKRKMILAHEWIEAMMSFRDRGHPQKQLNAEKIPMALLFNSLHLRSPWQDTPEFNIEMHAALRELLVSKKTILKTVKDFDTSIEEIKALIAAQDPKAGQLFRTIVAAFAQRHSVDELLVLDRFQEEFWAKPGS